ncbi:hypothetical protein EJ08DRAFT_702954 [Tothia fuscella]|uniref:Uncharacterized protein n=1 Tax=Tothia fuscella TaxID=1048955 RepID=A0A9P4NFS1_9PEZI|nr:hypothetical protein EJ08DRAFT_702954 [Tothia fuscella]
MTPSGFFPTSSAPLMAASEVTIGNEDFVSKFLRPPTEQELSTLSPAELAHVKFMQNAGIDKPDAHQVILDLSETDPQRALTLGNHIQNYNNIVNKVRNVQLRRHYEHAGLNLAHSLVQRTHDTVDLLTTTFTDTLNENMTPWALPLSKK